MTGFILTTLLFFAAFLLGAVLARRLVVTPLRERAEAAESLNELYIGTILDHIKEMDRLNENVRILAKAHDQIAKDYASSVKLVDSYRYRISGARGDILQLRETVQKLVEENIALQEANEILGRPEVCVIHANNAEEPLKPKKKKVQ